MCGRIGSKVTWDRRTTRLVAGVSGRSLYDKDPLRHHSVTPPDKPGRPGLSAVGTGQGSENVQKCVITIVRFLGVDFLYFLTREQSHRPHRKIAIRFILPHDDRRFLIGTLVVLKHHTTPQFLAMLNFRFFFVVVVALEDEPIRQLSQGVFKLTRSGLLVVCVRPSVFRFVEHQARATHVHGCTGRPTKKQGLKKGNVKFTGQRQKKPGRRYYTEVGVERTLF